MCWLLLLLVLLLLLLWLLLCNIIPNVRSVPNAVGGVGLCEVI